MDSLTISGNYTQNQIDILRKIWDFGRISYNPSTCAAEEEKQSGPVEKCVWRTGQKADGPPCGKSEGLYRVVSQHPFRPSKAVCKDHLGKAWKKLDGKAADPIPSGGKE